MSGISFTAPELCSYDGDISRPWFVYFDIKDQATGITLRKQFRGGINYSSDPKERMRMGTTLKNFWADRLKAGWTPFVNTSASSLSKMKFNEALDWALLKCNTASKTKRDYKCTVGFFKQAAKSLLIDKAFITGITRQHIMLMLDHIKTVRKWSNNAYNKNTVYISGVLSRLVEYQVIENNPAHNIKRLPVAETNMYETLTTLEKIIVRDHLTINHPAFFTYLMLIYHTGIRPKECLSLKISDVRLDKDLIIIKPVIENENSKTKSIRMVPLNSFISELLKLHLQGFEDSSLYIFGSLNNVGEGNRGSDKGGITGATRKGFFHPSTNHIKRDTATKLWKKLIWNGLGIHKYQYALKHSGADDKILAGVSLDALKEMYGHSSKLMTEKYAKSIKGIYMQQIINQSPDF